MLWYFVHLEYNPGEGGPSGSNEDSGKGIIGQLCEDKHLPETH